jgi:hypothetical protein
VTSISGGWGAQLVAHAQARLAADQAAKCAPCQIREDEKAVETAQGIAAAETSNGGPQGGGNPAASSNRSSSPKIGRLIDIIA